MEGRPGEPVAPTQISNEAPRSARGSSTEGQERGVLRSTSSSSTSTRRRQPTMRPRIALRSPRPSLHWQVPRQRPHSTAPPSQATLTSSSGHAFRWGLGAGAALTVAGAWVSAPSQATAESDAAGGLARVPC